MIGRLCILVLFVASLRAAEVPMPVQMPPIPPSPIEDFRRWLKLSAPEREKELAAYPEEKRKVLQAKLGTYERMPQEKRDAQLRMLELRWYLTPLMNAPAAERGNFLEIIPARLHDPIKARLKHWDGIEEATRREILADKNKRELITRYFVVPRRTSTPPPPFPTGSVSHASQLESHFKDWDSKSAADRARMCAQVTQFFDLNKDAQVRALNELSEVERIEMQNTLDAFAQLSPADRRACVESFQRLATMSPGERGSFLRNAARWQQLTPEERATWRDLVSKVPPMPPEPVPAPPIPDSAEVRPPGTSVASTNPTASAQQN